MARTFDITICSAVVIDGAVVTPGARVEVSEKLGRMLLARGKAVLASGKAAPEKAMGPLSTDGKGGAKPKGKAAVKPESDEGK